MDDPALYQISRWAAIATQADSLPFPFTMLHKELSMLACSCGYNVDNKNLDLLRLRSFTINKKLRDQDLLGLEARDRIAHIIGIMVPFVSIPSLYPSGSFHNPPTSQRLDSAQTLQLRFTLAVPGLGARELVRLGTLAYKLAF
ncbi:hypothetical protein PRK78_002180 [Emydomyces testavorans]|uniref:Uncharacterized protein n=1 Tax=Emydomyces testavorans TaxID=2070801 RepID=A0AAF0DDQ0_9EURO|nr:hypothetical protein PRK78_002180 [Emydomyces testavorans]